MSNSDDLYFPYTRIPSAPAPTNAENLFVQVPGGNPRYLTFRSVSLLEPRPTPNYPVLTPLPPPMKRRRDAEPYQSFTDAWAEWGEEWGPRVKNASNAAGFAKDLLLDNGKAGKRASDHRGAYNSGRYNYAQKVTNAIESVERRLPSWLSDQGTHR
jgi:hypothetical protein